MWPLNRKEFYFSTVFQVQFNAIMSYKNCKEEGNFKLYASTLNSPKYVDEEGCFFIGHILSPGHEFLPKHIIYIDVCFGETQIMFLAQQPKSDKFFLCYLGD